MGDPGEVVRKRIASEDLRNKRIPLAVQKRHLAELTDVLSGIIRGTMHPYALAGLAERAITQGLPVSSQILFAPEQALAQEARRIALCLPSLSSLHRDCRLYLAEKTHKRAQDVDGSISFNICLGGQVVNPTGM